VCCGEYNSISESLQIFPHLNLNLEHLEVEYRLLSETEHLKKLITDINEFYAQVAQMKNALDNLMFPNLTKVA
jgi:succinate dehydrogenase/fumarate reductase-like Fe-S protein